MKRLIKYLKENHQMPAKEQKGYILNPNQSQVLTVSKKKKPALKQPTSKETPLMQPSLSKTSSQKITSPTAITPKKVNPQSKLLAPPRDSLLNASKQKRPSIVPKLNLKSPNIATQADQSIQHLTKQRSDQA